MNHIKDSFPDPVDDPMNVEEVKPTEPRQAARDVGDKRKLDTSKTSKKKFSRLETIFEEDGYGRSNHRLRLDGLDYDSLRERTMATIRAMGSP